MTSSVRAAVATATRTPPAAKAPAVTGWFWATALPVAALGEALADGLQRRSGPSLTVSVSAGLLAIAVVAQVGVRRYVAALYWTAFTLTGVTVTLVADSARTSLGLSDAATTAAFAAVFAALLAAGYAGTRTPAVRGLRSRRREVYHWTAVASAVGFGVALGDWTTAALDLGFLVSAVLSALVLAVPALARLCGLHAVAAFWAALVLSRPLGASVADWLAVPADHGGLGWGTTRVAAVTGALSLALATALSLTRADTDPGTEAG